MEGFKTGLSNEKVIVQTRIESGQVPFLVYIISYVFLPLIIFGGIVYSLILNCHFLQPLDQLLHTNTAKACTVLAKNLLQPKRFDTSKETRNTAKSKPSIIRVSTTPSPQSISDNQKNYIDALQKHLSINQSEGIFTLHNLAGESERVVIVDERGVVTTKSLSELMSLLSQEWYNIDYDNQKLSLTDNTLSISGGNSIRLPTNSQTLSINGNTLSISDGNSITLPGSTTTSAGTDNWGTQTVVTNLSLSGNGTTTSPLGLSAQSANIGQVLKWNGTSWVPANDIDTDTNSGGTVTSITTGAGLVPVNIINSGQIALDTSSISGCTGATTDKLLWDSLNLRLTCATDQNTGIGGGDNWGTQVASVNVTLAGDGTTGNPLRIAQQGAALNQVLKWNGTSWAPANDIDTDTDTDTNNYVTSAAFSGTTTKILTIGRNALSNIVASFNDIGFDNPLTTSGDLMYGGSAGTPTRLPGATTNGYTLKYNTSTNTPYWAPDIDTDTNSGGTVTSVASGNGLTGGPINSSGTLSLNTSSIGSCTGGSDKIIWDSVNNRLTCGIDYGGTGSDNWGTQVVQKNSTLIGDGTSINVLGLNLANANTWSALQTFSNGANINSGLTVNGGLTVSTGTVSLPAGSISNSALANSGVTITAGTGLSGGGPVSLGGTVTLDIGAGTGITVAADTVSVNMSAFTTDNLAEGTTNLYWTLARFNSAFASKSTTDLAEGTNLYFSDERVDDRVAALIQNGTGISWTYNDVANTLTAVVNLGTFTTDNLTEGSTNLYFTNARARSALSVTAPLTYNSGTGVIGITQASGSTNGYLSSTDWTTFNNKENVLTFSSGLTRTGNSITADLGTSVDSSEIVNGTVTFTDWAGNGCASNEIPKYNGSAWVCSTDNAGTGTVTGSGTATQIAYWSSASGLTSSSNLYWDTTNVRLGIGTNAPAASLSVGSTSQFQVNSTGAIAAATGISSSGIINFSGLTGSKVVFTDGSKNLTSTGTVGADQGGTGQSTYTTGDLLYASGATTLSKLAATTNGYVLTLAGGVPTWAAASTTCSTCFVNGGNSFSSLATIGTNDAFNLGFRTNNTVKMTLDTSGNLGINTTTPLLPLHVNGLVGLGSNISTVGTGSGKASRTLNLIDPSSVIRVWRYIDTVASPTGGDPAIEFIHGNGAFDSDTPNSWWDIVSSKTNIESSEGISIRRRTGGVITTFFSIGSTGNIGISDSNNLARMAIKGASTGSGTVSLAIRDSLNNPLFYVRDNGYVGVGTNSPNARFDVRGDTIDTQGNNFIGLASMSNTIIKNDPNIREFYGLQVKPTLNTGVSNANTTYNLFSIDTTNTATTGLTTNLIKAAYGGIQKFLVNSNGDVSATGTVNISSLTGSKVVFTDGSKNLTSTGTVGADQGGTGQSTYTTGDLLYASGATTLSKLAATTNGYVLTLAGGVPTWAASGACATCFVQSGNSFGVDAVIGTNDNNGLTLETNNTVRMNISNTGLVSIYGGSPGVQLFVDGSISSPGALGSSEHFGESSVASQAYDHAFGYNAYATGSFSSAFGANTVASANSAAVYGAFASATGANSLAVGTYTAANFNNSYAIGSYINTTASNQMVIGNGVFGIDPRDFYLGMGVTNVDANTAGGIVLNATGGNGTDVAGADFAIAGGKGTGSAVGGSLIFKTSSTGVSGSTLNSLVTRMSIDSAGNINIPGLSASSGIYTDGSKNLTTTAPTSGVLGYWSRTGASLKPATSGDSISVPGSGTDSEKFGKSSIAGGIESSAFGANADATAPRSSVFGAYTRAGSYSVAVGRYSVSDGTFATSVGNFSQSPNDYGSAFGHNAGALGIGGTALGSYTSVTANYSIALGYNAHVTDANTMVIGSDTFAENIHNIYFNGITSSAPSGTILQGAGGSGTNIAGASLSFAGGQGTGTGVGGDLIFKTAPAGVTGSALNSLVERMRITPDGNVGIGTSSPTDKLMIQGGGLRFNSSGNAIDFASASDGNIFTMKVPRKATTGTCASAANEGLKIHNNGGTQVGHICIDGPTSATPNKLRFYAEQFNATSTDLAENYSDHSNSLQAGDVVSVDPNYVKSAIIAGSENSILGVVSTSPGLLLTDIDESGASTEMVNPKPIALAGRVPVKVNAEGGSIKPGDYLTLSSQTGVATKANRAGYMIGIALEAWSPNSGKNTVLINVNNDYADPQNKLSQLTFNQNGDLIIQSYEQSLANLSSQATAQGSALNTLMSNVQSVQSTQSTELNDQSSQLIDVKTKIQEFSTQLASISAQITGLNNWKSTTNLDLQFIKDEISYLKTINNSSNSSSSALLDSQIATLEALTVSDKANINDLGVTGNIIAGLVTIDGVSAEINTLNKPLKIQSLGLGSVDFLNGKVTIEQKGSLAINNGQVKGNDSFRGKVVLKAGQTEIQVNKTWETAPESINLTTTFNGKAWIEQVDTTGFTIKVDTVQSNDKDIYWMALW